MEGSMVPGDFAEYVKKYRAMSFRIAYGYVKDTYDADDITQDVFLKLYKALEQNENPFETEENMKAWLIRVTVNQSKSLLRTAWRNRKTELTETEAAQSELPDDCFELYEYVKTLKPKYRTVIYLFYYEGYPVKEIAEILNIKESAVTTQLSRARFQLKQVLLAEGYT